MKTQAEKSLAQILYEAYCESAEWKSAITGAALPQWENAPEAVKKHWGAAEDAAIDWAISARQTEERGGLLSDDPSYRNS
jgi:hypothetical protein